MLNMDEVVYDLPSVDFAFGVLENDPGLSSGLSEAPSDIDGSDIEQIIDTGSEDSDAGFELSRDSTPGRKRSFSTLADDPSISDDQLSFTRPTKAARFTPDKKDLAPLEAVAAEVWPTDSLFFNAHSYRFFKT